MTSDYSSKVAERLVNDGFEVVEGLADKGQFEEVYANRVKSLKLGGWVHKFVATLEPVEINAQFVKENADGLRGIMTDESVNVFGIGENMLGYVVFAGEGLSPDVRFFIEDGYDHQRMSSWVFPVVVDLSKSEVVHAPVPRIKQRNVYSTQKKDAEEYFQP